LDKIYQNIFFFDSRPTARDIVPFRGSRSTLYL
jgi:hypothetical protein